MDYGSYRFTRAEINLERMAYNVAQLKKKLQPNTKFMAVVKADAYGHGAVEVSKELERQEVDYLAVAVLDEALELRDAGVTKPILVLSPLELETISTAVANNIAMTIFTKEAAEEVCYQAEKLRQEAIVHIKVDSGMSRIGVLSSEEAYEVAKALESEYVNREGIFTHFADAENLEDPAFTHQQFTKFMEIITYLENKSIPFPLRHCCNTAATLAYPDYHLDMVRSGISIYGYHPDKKMESFIDLKPVMTLKTHAAFIKPLPAGQSIGYGRSYTPENDAIIATILLGYADGVPRQLSNRWHFYVKEQKAPIVGRVCMDQIMLDVTDIEELSEEDEIIFFGDPNEGHPSIYDIAELTVGFHYELLCGIGKRIPRVYIENKEVQFKQNVLLD